MVKDKLVYLVVLFWPFESATYNRWNSRPIKGEIACSIFQVNCIDGWSINNVVEYNLLVPK